MKKLVLLSLFAVAVAGSQPAFAAGGPHLCRLRLRQASRRHVAMLQRQGEVRLFRGAPELQKSLARRTASGGP
jgi:hypothetical protein